MTWPSSDPVSPRRLTALRDEALEQGHARAALLFQLHLLALEDTPEERDRLLFLLPEHLRQLENAPACAEVLLFLFSGRPGPWPAPFFSFGTAALMEIALLLREEAERFSPRAAEALAEHINQTVWAVYGESTYVYEMLVLYEIVHFYQGQPGAPVISLYRDVLEDCLDTLAQIDGASVSDLLLIVGNLLGEDRSCRREARGLLERCVALRQEYFEECSPFLMTVRCRLMELCYVMEDAGGALEELEILLRQPETEPARTLLCHAHLLAADLLLDRLDTAGVAEHLCLAGELLGRLPGETAQARRLSFRLDTGWARYYFSNAEADSGLSQMELHAKRAYLLARQEGYGGEDTLAAINNLLYPLAYSSQDGEVVRLLQEAAALIDARGLHHTRAAAILGVTASMFGLEELLPPGVAGPINDLSRSENDGVLRFWALFHSADSQLRDGRPSPEQLEQIRAALDRCQALLDQLRPGVTSASISLKRARALLALRQGDGDAARRWTRSALEDARTHQALHPQGMLFSTVLPLLPFLPDLLDGDALQALLDQLARGMDSRVRRILDCRDEEYILNSLWSNTVVLNFTLALADRGIVTWGPDRLYELIINGKAVYSRLLRISRRRREAHPEDESVYRRIDRLRAEILDGKVEELLRGVPRDVSGPEEEKRLLELSLAGSLPDAFRWISCREICRRLPPGAALVDYYAYPANLSGQLLLEDMRYAVFVLFRRADGTPCLRRLPSVNFLRVRRALLSLTDSLSARAGILFCRTLHRLLVQPAESLLGPEVDTLFLSPDGDLPKLPFGLLCRAPDSFLCDRYSLVYLESARDLKPDQVIDPAGREALVMGNPDFSLTPADPAQRSPGPVGSLVEKVPFTKLEAQMVAEKTGAPPLMRRRADKHALQDCRASIIHIATHGAFFSDREEDGQVYEYSPNPMRRACLYFAGVNDWLLTGKADPVLGNGVLTAEELCHCRMAPPDLVVLSACFSGMGDVRQGSGIVGFQTAFKVQGARAMLLSIWEADDFASLVLMDRFYDNLSSMPAGQALRSAQRYLRTATIADLTEAGWFDPRRLRRIGLVAEDMRRMSRLSPAHRPFASLRCWGGYILYE